MKSTNPKIRFFLNTLLASGLVAGLALLSPALAAAALTVTPSTWNIIGLDSNSPAFGPNRFPVGAKVCGGTPGASDTAAFYWDAGGSDNGTYIYLRPGSANPVSITFGADGCADAYFEVEVDKTSASFDKTRRYHIVAGAVSTPIRELYVEHLISQSRNYITNVSLDGASIPAGGSMNLVVGNTYTIKLYGGTATQGYNQFEEFINFPNTIFQVLSVTTDYSANDSPYVSTSGHKSLYADACGWENDPNSPYYRSCMGGNYKSGGSNVVTTYTVRIVGGGGSSERLSTLLYDFSGASFHYNADYSTGARFANIIDPTSVNIAKSFAPNPTNTDGVSALTFTLANPNGGAVGGVNFTDIFPTSPGAMVVADPPNATTNGCGTPTFTPSAGAPSVSFSNGTIAPYSSCTVKVNVTVPATGAYANTSGNLFVGTLDTGKSASATLTVDDTSFPPLPPPSACANPVELARWSMAPSQGTSVPPLYFSKASDVTSATASYTGSGTQAISTAEGNPANSWRATGWTDTPGSLSATAPPYFEFALDTSKYGGVRIAFDYALLANGDWAANNNNDVFVYSSADGGPFSTIANVAASKGSWQTGAYGIAANAATTGTGTTSFRINAQTRNGNKPNAAMHLDNIVFSGCIKPDPPTISKSFAPNPVAVGSTSTLTLTVTNPNAGEPLSGVAFTDTLPAGLTVADGSSAQCGGTLTTTAPDLLSFSGGTLAAGASCAIAATVTATTAGPHDNVSGFVSATASGANTGATGVAAASLTAISPPNIAKQFAPNPILADGVSKLTFTITNPNPNHALNGVAFADTFPAGMVVAGPTGASTSGCGTPTFAPVAAAGSIAFSDATIAASGTCTVTVDVTAPATGTYDNTSDNVSHTLNGTWNGNAAADTLNVNEPFPSIALLKQAGPSATGPWTSFLAVAPDADVYYQLTVENTGDAPLSPVSVDDPLVSTAGCVWPATLPVAVAVNDDHLATCVMGPATAVEGSNLNTATASGTYSGTDYTDQSSARYATTGLTLTKSADKSYFLPPAGSPAVYDTIGYTFEVNNSGWAPLAGPVAISDAKISVTCPAVSTVGDGDNYLDRDEILTCTVTYTTVDADVTAREVVNTATATVSGITSNAASVTVPLIADLSAVKTNNVGGTAPDASFVWTLTVSNSATAGKATFADGQVLLQDDLPASGATYTLGSVTRTAAISGPINCAIASNTLTCTANGGSVALPGGLQGTVAVANGSATVTGTGTAFTTQLSAGNSLVLVGTLYTVLSVESDTSLTLSADYAGADSSGLTVPASFSVPVTVDIATAGSLVNPRSGGICQADPGAVVGDSNAANNACSNTVIIGAPLLTILKSADRAGAAPGQTITYTVQVANTGNGVATRVVLTDRLSPYTAFGLDFAEDGDPKVPFSLTDGSPVSGLTLPIPDPEFSVDGGTNWSPTLTDEGGGAPPGYDGTATNWRITMPPGDKLQPGGSFTLQYKTKVR